MTDKDRSGSGPQKGGATSTERVAKRRARFLAQGLKEASSVIVPAHREAELRAIARQWTEEHLKSIERKGGKRGR